MIPTCQHAYAFLDELAVAVYEAMAEDSEESAASVSAAVLLVKAVMQREASLLDQMAACLVGSIKDGRLREDEALVLLSAWKNAGRSNP